MYNCTNLHTGSAVALVTMDRAARPHLSSSVENQLGRRIRRRQLLTIGQWNVMTLFVREGANRQERRKALVAMELAKYNIDIAALCETKFSESGNLNDLEFSFFWSGKPEGERREAGVGFAIKKDIVTKLTEMPRQIRETETTSEQGQCCYNYQRVRSNNDKPRRKQGVILQQAGKCVQWHPSYR